jgi:hypothetical protein
MKLLKIPSCTANGVAELELGKDSHHHHHHHWLRGPWSSSEASVSFPFHCKVPRIRIVGGAKF